MPAVQYLIEIDAYSLDSAAVQTLYFSTHPLNTGPTDSPANVAYIARAVVPFSLERSLFDGDRIGGKNVPARGFCELNNGDAALDYLTEYSFNTRQFRIYRGAVGAGRGSFTKIYQGVTEQIEFSDRTVTIRLRDRLYVFDKPLQPNLYNASVQNSLEGKPKPLVFGQATGVPAALIHAANQEYQVNDGAIAALTVRDRGVTLSPIAASGGSFTLSGAPAGVVECDVRRTSPYGGGDDAASVFLWIVRDYAGLALADINTASFTALGSTPQVGMFFNDEIKIIDVLDQLAATIGAFYYFDKNDQLTIGRFDLPETVQSKNIDLAQTFAFSRDQTAIPAWAVVYNFNRRYRPMSKEELAGSVNAYDVGLYATATLSRKAEDAAIKTPYPNARRITIDGVASGNEAVFAQAEAARQLNLYRDQRDVFKLRVAAQPFTYELAETAQIVLARYSFNLGRNFRIIAITDSGLRDEIELTLWGPGRGFLLQEDGGAFLFEDGSGYLLLEGA